MREGETERDRDTEIGKKGGREGRETEIGRARGVGRWR